MRNRYFNILVQGFCIIAGAFWSLGPVLGQKPPNVCQNPPTPYKIGGDFVVKYQVGGKAEYVTEICVPADGQPVFFETVNSESSLKEVKYLYDVKDDNMIPLPDQLALVNRVGISVADTGTYWIMQVALDTRNQPVAQCKPIKIKSPIQSPILTENTASIDELGKITVTLQPNPLATTYRLFQDGLLISEDAATSYEFPAPQTKPACFTTSYLGECQIWTPPSPPFCPPWLEWDNKEMLMTWQLPNEYEKTRSILYALTEFGIREVVCEDCKQPLALDIKWLNRNIQFEVLVEIFRNGTLVGAWSNQIELPAIPIPIFPTIFTKNNDEWNEELKGVFPGPVKPKKIQIVNRQGQIIKTINDPWTWDGKDESGAEVSSGQYICRINYMVREYEFVYTHSFLLIR